MPADPFGRDARDERRNCDSRLRFVLASKKCDTFLPFIHPPLLRPSALAFQATRIGRVSSVESHRLLDRVWVEAVVTGGFGDRDESV